MFSDPDKVIKEMFVSEGMTVADFGSGVGFYTIPLARRVGPYGRVFAVDVMGDFLRKLKNEAVRSGLNNVEVIQGDLESINGSGLLTASLDRVIIANTLFQSDHPLNVVLEAKRVIKYSGKVAVIDWEDSFSQIGPHKDHLVTKEETRELFEKNGFTFESFIDAGQHHYGMLYSVAETPIPGAEANLAVDVSNSETNPAVIVPPVEFFNH
jgi:ubiquinone/menaquinone biosynthesis C-methylase UbiE